MTQLELRSLLVSVRSVADALPLYEQGLGLPLKFSDGDHYAALDGGGITVALAADADHPAPGEVALAFKTDDVTSAVEALVASGMRVERPPAEGPHEIRALLRDRSGTAISVYGPKVAR